MDNTSEFSNTPPELARLADFLFQRQDEILAQWRDLIGAEKEKSALLSASQEEFYDDIPQFLETLFAAFRGERSTPPESNAEKHGAERWRLGMNMRETAREWGFLHEVLVKQIATYCSAEQTLSSAHQGLAYQVLAQYINHSITASLAQHYALHRLEAEARMRDLESASRQWRELEARRGEYFRQILHDLRGGLSVIRLAGTVLKQEGSEDELIETAADIITTTESMNRLLNQMSDLARLEAGRETMELAPFDAAELLQSLCNTMRPVAQEKGLALVCQGEEPLTVEGDGPKVQRIAQNLILNALNYTHAGRVDVEWHTVAPGKSWGFYVRDSGPGLPTASAGDLARGMEQAGRTAFPAPQHQLDNWGDEDAGSAGGEGIGLIIVRRLCELLDGVIEVTSGPHQGTEFRITLPVNYAEAGSQQGR